VEKSNYGSFACGSGKCKACPFVNITQTITDSDGKVIDIKNKMTCQSASLIYMIQCDSCGMRYIGETNQSLHQRLCEHRSAIKRNKTTPVAQHFNNGTCDGLDSLSITPLELVPRLHPTNDLGLVSIKDILNRMEREQFWIRKLKTRDPNGINKKTELRPPIPFIVNYSDQSSKISNIVREMYQSVKL